MHVSMEIPSFFIMCSEPAHLIFLTKGLPPGNDKIRGTLSNTENFVPKQQNKINLKKGFYKYGEFPRIRGRMASL